ncbi:anoctamin-7 isoform X7 [Lynx rufus]|uniref:anoctamin-7 isoform X7 n=1 Tax=Lynx rufus TaxID=61384 RepID=UPI001F1264BB|nr:anoctamin-7 isoform X7 [Lynx rufus]
MASAAWLWEALLFHRHSPPHLPCGCCGLHISGWQEPLPRHASWCLPDPSLPWPQAPGALAEGLNADSPSSEAFLAPRPPPPLFPSSGSPPEPHTYDSARSASLGLPTRQLLVHRARSGHPQRALRPRASPKGRFCSGTGLAGASGTSTSLWTTCADTSGRRWPSTSPGLGSTRAGSCRQRQWALWCSWRAVSWCSQTYPRRSCAAAPITLRCARSAWTAPSGCSPVPAPWPREHSAGRRAQGSHASHSRARPRPQAGRLFDHGGTVFFSAFMALWAVLLLEYWKRQSATLAYRWGCSDYEDIEERPRPQFAASAPTTAPNPVTGEDEPYFPERSRVRRVLAGSTVVVMMVAVVVVCLVSVILYRAIMAILVSRSNNTLLAAWASRIASFTGSVVNLVFILVLSKIYVALAHILTRWEMHRTQTKFEDAFTLKVFIFQFVNFYSSPIYIAFFKGRFVGHPGNYHTLFGVRNEECAAGGCLIELAQELLVIMVGKQIINNVQEILVPKLQGWWQKFRLRSKKRKAGASEAVGQAPWEADYELLPCEGLFDEYLEMVLQFGFVTIFVAACPLAPLFALLNNWVEIRLDARKFVCEHRRPVAERAQDIGIWSHILAGIAHLAVVSNAFLLAFSSDFLPRAYYRWTRAPDLRGFVNFTLARAPPAFASAHNRTCRYQAFREDDGQYSPTYWNLLAIRLAFVIVFEHVVFSIGRILDLLVPDIPESVEVKVKREYYLAKQALAENEALSGTNGAKDNYSQSSERSLGPQPTLPGGGQASQVPSL